MKRPVLATILCLLVLTPLRVHAQEVPASSQQMQLSFAPLVKKTAPAVVNIYTKRVVRERMAVISPFMNDPFFSQFFGGQMLAGPERERIERSLGSGVILDAKGTVATNHHVVKDADDITVVTADGREFEAKKLLDDARVDLAVLKIDPKGEALSHLDIGDSDAAQVGDLVLAIGNPFGVGQTVTSGIISALSRTAAIRGNDYSVFIQTDAAINPGNSGGALVDMQGRLLGINTAIYSKDGGSNGIGFAIPASMLKTVVRAAEHGGKLVHPWVGLSSQDVTAEMAETLGLRKAGGTLVSRVVAGSPADKAGVKTGDVVLALDGKEVQDARALRFRLATVPLGTTVVLSVWRGGKMIDLAMTAIEPPEIPPRDRTKIEGANPLSGAVVVNISPAVQEEMGPLAQNKGVVIERVEDGNAARFGLQPGDIVLMLNDKDVESVAALKTALKARVRVWLLHLLRNGQVIKLSIGG